MVTCVDRSLCELDKHVLVEDGAVKLTDDMPSDCDVVHLTPDEADPYCLRTLFRLESKEFDVSAPSRYAKMNEVINKAHDNPWSFVHPSNRIRWALDKSKEANVLLSGCERGYHMNIFTECSNVFAKLRPWRVNADVALSTDPNAVSCLTEDGWVRPPRYNRFGTRTGRLTVLEGARVLTVRHDTREFFLPIDDDHHLVQLDFSALEARVALGIAGRSVDIDSDPYTVIAKLVDASSRDTAKTATFSALYSDPTAKTQKDPIVSKVRRIFKLGEVFSELKHAPVVRNLYGRLIPDPIEETLYNNYVQSTGADVVLLGFNSMMDDLTTNGVVPHFLLHDALYVSVPKNQLTYVNKLCKSGVQVKNFDFSFPIKASVIGESASV